MTDPTPLLSLQDILFSYESGQFSLEVQELSLHPGESVMCMGPSGSGKTTLLELMAGLQDPKRGQARLQGKTWTDLTKNQRQQLRLQSMGLVFQGFELLAALTLEENVLLPLRFLGRSPKQELPRCHELMQSLGILDLAHKKPAESSFGERQRAAICRALITRPAVILADEPTANLDQESADLALSLLLDQSKTQGAALFLISHDSRHTDLIDRMVSMDSLAPGLPT
ncbi:MAG: ATP-binding cassette domain-containing protein [bacterium]|nr:ATP-binding cassette domain-containing protein [bacterium]